MGRRKLKPGEMGAIWTDKLRPGVYQATVRVGTIEGKSVLVRATADGMERARDAVKIAAQQRAYRGSLTTGVNKEMTLGELLDETIVQLKSGTLPLDSKKKLRPQTIQAYENVIPIIRGKRDGIDNIAAAKLVDVETNILRNWLRAVNRNIPGSAKQVKALLSHAFDLAMENINGGWDTNPARAVRLVKQEDEDDDGAPIRLSEHDYKRIQDLVKAWQTPYKKTDLSFIVAGLVVTGFRPNELLGLHWADIEFGDGYTRAWVHGTLVKLKDGGIIYQPYPKTKDGFRRVFLPQWFTTWLLEKRVTSTSELVFPNCDGGYLDRGNVGKKWREARGKEYAHVPLKGLRSANAARITDKFDIEDAALALGHSDSRITATYYVHETKEAGDYSSAFETLEPEWRKATSS